VGFLKKLQSQPEYIRKMVLWSVVIILGLGLVIWWINSSYQKLKKFEKEEFIKKMNLPSFRGELENLPEIKIPKIDEGKELRNNEQ